MWLGRVMIKLPNTLSFKLTFWHAISFSVILLVTLLILYFSVSSYYDKTTDEDLYEDIEEYRSLMSTKGIDGILDEIKQEELTEQPDEFFIQVLDLNGNVTHSSDLSYWQGLKIDKLAFHYAAQGEDVLKTISLEDRESPDRVAYAKIGPNIVIYFAESSNEKNEVMEMIFFIFLIMLFIVIPLAFLAAWLITKHSLSGLNEVSNAAFDIEQGQFDRKVILESENDEIRFLADQFNSMAERIKILIREMREMIDNIAHDLRSPIGRIRAISEDSLSGNNSNDHYRSAASDTLEECDRLIKLINTTLDVAEAEARVDQIIKEQINLSALIEDACELFGPVAEQKGIQLIHKVQDNCTINGMQSNLQRMFANLIDNALKYTSTPGKIQVELNKNSTHYDIKVSDNGMGIPETEQTRVFDRFYRCDHSRSNEGCGLGLSFARAVARAHGGDISIFSEIDNGSIFTISLPLPTQNN